MDDKIVGELWRYYQDLRLSRTVWMTKDQVHAEKGIAIIRKLISERAARSKVDLKTAAKDFGIDNYNTVAQGQLESSRGLLEVLKAQVQQQNNREVELEAEVESLRSQLEQLASVTDQLRQSVQSRSTLRMNLASANEVICGIKEAHADLIKAVVSCKAQGQCRISYSEIEVADYPLRDSPTCGHKEDVERLKASTIELDRHHKEEHEFIISLQAQLAESKKEVKTLKSQMVVRDEQNQETMRQYVKIATDLQAQLAQLVEEAERLSDRDDCRKRLAESEKYADQLEHEKADLEGLLTVLKEEVERLRVANEHSHIRMSPVETERVAYSGAIEIEQDRNEVLQVQLAQVREALNEANGKVMKREFDRDHRVLPSRFLGHRSDLCDVCLERSGWTCEQWIELAKALKE